MPAALLRGSGAGRAPTAGRRRRAHGRDRVDEPARGADEAAGVVVAVVAHHLHVARVARVAGDDHAVAAVRRRAAASRDARSSSRRVTCSRMIARLAVDDALHLEAHRRGRALLDDAEAEVDRLAARAGARAPRAARRSRRRGRRRAPSPTPPHANDSTPGISSSGFASSGLPKPIVSNSTVGCA